MISEEFRWRGLPVLCIASVPAHWALTGAWWSEGRTAGIFRLLPASPYQLLTPSQDLLPSVVPRVTLPHMTRVIQPASDDRGAGEQYPQKTYFIQNLNVKQHTRFYAQRLPGCEQATVSLLILEGPCRCHFRMCAR